MSRYAVVLAAGALALFLLVTTQEWVVAVVEPAPGAPSVRTSRTGAAAVAWGPAAALIGLASAAASGAARTTGRWPSLVVAATGAVAAAAAVRVTLDPAGVLAGAEVVTARATAWAWAAAVLAPAATATALWSLRAPSRAPARRPPGDTPAERDRRAASEQWRMLSEGDDPTRGA
ncbi:Trp biosynthesis-associated membrane protein [Ornithinimicrobium cerasi]|uniref:Tryptophan-associated transmembrane protein (Trp_oprn_chp) n=1 Tax=Ornithinimicrobium cerasi TaxID=2248773 RepID=A0A285VLW8_9MICO|nr:Trp biosynthesis-associated membrane protein [Ornithinimicrobium cerasi]SOC54558.1 Tryptophan-associated transmembrane protein (Trp_oprn_chp) [Ornithinimicrobium cerasi]